MSQSATSDGEVAPTPTASRPGALRAAAPPGLVDAATTAAAAAGGRRFRGKNKAPAWRRPAEVTVVRLPLTPDPAARHRLEQLFGAAWSLTRAVRRDARARSQAYRAGWRRRSTPE